MADEAAGSAPGGNAKIMMGLLGLNVVVMVGVLVVLFLGNKKQQTTQTLDQVAAGSATPGAEAKPAEKVEAKTAEKPADPVADKPAEKPAQDTKPETAPEQTPEAKPASNEAVETAAPEKVENKDASEATQEPEDADKTHKKTGMIQWMLATPWVLAGGAAGLLTAAVMSVLVIKRRRAAKGDDNPLAEVGSDPLAPLVAATGESHDTNGAMQAMDMDVGEPPELVQTIDDVELRFPADSSPAPGQVLNDLDDLANETAAATAAIEQLRSQTQMSRAEKRALGATDDVEELAPLEVETDFAQAGEPEAPAVTQEDISQAISDLDVDLPNPPLDEAGWQEVATKLDLASAYVEIGDSDGAIGLLKEVISKGDQAQVRKAKDLQKMIKV